MKIRRCHNCDKYFEFRKSVDNGITCSQKCSDDYVKDLNDDIKNYYKNLKLKTEPCGLIPDA